MDTIFRADDRSCLVMKAEDADNVVVVDELSTVEKNWREGKVSFGASGR